MKIFSGIGNSSRDTNSLEDRINDWLKTITPRVESQSCSTCVVNGNVVKTITILYTI